MFFLGEDDLTVFLNSHAWVMFSNFLSTPSFNFSAAVIWKEYIWINDYDGGCQSTTVLLIKDATYILTLLGESYPLCHW